MLRILIVALCALVCMSDLADAQERQRLGYGRLISNDFWGDGGDRWRTGGFQSSHVWGPTWTGTAPAGFGQLLELRLAAEVISPDGIVSPAPGDRPYAGAITVGLHTHFVQGPAEYSVGGDIVFVGSQTRLDEVQVAIHDAFNIVRPSDAVLDAQVDNDILPSAVFEVGRTYQMGETTSLRPFAEVRAGVETLVRAGADLTFGRLGQGELLVRDSVTGHRYRVVQADWSGFSFVLGADIAHVTDSEFLPSERGFSARDTRERVRAGVMWRGESGLTGFYGITYLGEEFDGQSEGQFVGSVRLRIPF